MQQVKYRRFSGREREEISRGLARGEQQVEIARRLGRDPGALSREVARNGGRSGYCALSAMRRAEDRAASRRRGRRRLAEHERLRTFVMEKLKLEWSPEQVVRELVREYPHDEDMRISPETIYRYIYVLPRGTLRRSLVNALRQERKYRRKRRSGAIAETRGKIADMISIEERPKEVEDRTIPGHWEGDLILGKHKRTALGTLVERTTRYTMLVPLKAKDAASVRRAYARSLTRLPRELARSLTYDQGKEMSEHARFTVDTGINIFFAHPGSPWERGTNENTNGLIRQYFPKGTEFNRVSAREIRRAENRLNGRPRRVLHYEKPVEAFTRLVALNS